MDNQTTTTLVPSVRSSAIAAYAEQKSKRPDVLFLFAVGGRYEAYRNDAVAFAKITGQKVTKVTNGEDAVEVSSIERPLLETTLPKLIRAGRRVAICEKQQQA